MFHLVSSCQWRYFWPRSAPLPSSYYHLSILFQIASFALYEILKSRIRAVKAILHFFVQVTRDFKINQLKCLLGSCHHVKRPLASPSKGKQQRYFSKVKWEVNCALSADKCNREKWILAHEKSKHILRGDSFLTDANIWWECFLSQTDSTVLP